MTKIKYFFLLVSLLTLASCKKQELFHENQDKLVQVNLQGLILSDTLEFVMNDKVICTAFDNVFTANGKLFDANSKVQIRKKATTKLLGEFTLGSNFNQTRKIFYDGINVSDNIELTPVSDPNNMGFRLNFSTKFAAFYGGPVDVELFIQEIDNETGSPSYTSVKVIKNVTGSFSEFIELPTLEITEAYFRKYALKVYKAGTKELPYTDKVDLSNVYDLANNYGTIDSFIAGDSQLLSISPGTWDDFTLLGDGYNIQDYSSAFK